MLASSRGHLDPGPWLVERKFDGSRLMAVVEAEVRLFSRYGKDATMRFAHLATDVPARPMVLDGEAVALQQMDDDFGALKRGRATHFVVFDVLFLDGKDVRSWPLRERRELLKQINFGPSVIRSHAVEGDPAAMLDAACRQGWEGLIAKKADSPYQSGRSLAWRKLKCRHEQDFQVVGYRENADGAPSLLLAERGVFVGALRAGLRDESLQAVAAFLARLPPAPSLADVPGVWVATNMKWRVSYVSRTPDGRLRQARLAAAKPS